MLKVDINLLWTVINLLVLLLIVKLFLMKPVKKILAQRQEMVDQSMAQAEQAREEAVRIEAAHADAMKGIEEEKSRVLANASQKAAAEYDRIVSEAREEADGIVTDAKAEAESAKAKILRKANQEIAELVVSAAGKVVCGQGDADSALYDLFLEKVGDTDDETNH